MGMKIKILSGFLLLSFMLAIAGAWSIYELRSTGSSVHALLDDNYRSIHASEDMNDALERQDSAILLLLLGKWEEGRTMLFKADSLFNEKLEFAYSNITLPGEKVLLDSIKTKYAEYKNLWERPIVNTPHEGNIEWYFVTVHHKFLSVKKSIEKLNNLNYNAMYRTSTSLQKRSDRAIMPGLIAIIAALVFTIIFNYFVHYYIVNPIIKITDRIKRFMMNKTPYDVTIESNDEIRHLSESISQLCELVQNQEVHQ